MGTARTRRTPVPPVEPTDDVAPLVEDPAPSAAPASVDVAAVLEMVAAAPEVAAEPDVDVESELPTRFVVAFHEGLDAHAVMARTALEDWDGWKAVEDLPDGEPPLLPARFTAQAD